MKFLEFELALALAGVNDSNLKLNLKVSSAGLTRTPQQPEIYLPR